MAKFRNFAKIMAWLVMLGGMAISIVLAVNFFIMASQYGSYGGSAAAASFVWYGIGSILVGFIFSIGSFVIINMITEMYVNSCIMRSKFCGDYYAPHPMQMTQQYSAPVQQPALWYCTNCSAQNAGTSSFCEKCGQPRK